MAIVSTPSPGVAPPPGTSGGAPRQRKPRALRERRVPAQNAWRRSQPVRAPRRDTVRELTVTGDRAPIWWRLVALLIIVGATILPRWIDVDRLVTPDEPIWLARSANFYQALSARDWASTYQYAHPGVPVMWLGAAAYRVVAPDYPERVGEQISQRQNRIAGILEAQGRDPLEIMVAGRKALILAMAVIVSVAYWVTLRLFGFWETTLGFLLLVLEPFTIGITRLLHVDGLASFFMLLSVVAGVAYVFRGARRRDLVISGIAAGLAVLTRSQMGFLSVWFCLMVLGSATGWRFRWPGWPAARQQVVRPAVLWGLVSLATVIVCWPALWANPVGTIKGMLDFAGTAALEGHERAVYFVGFVYEGDPGWRFYPASFIWRATPATLLGLAAAALVLVRFRRWSIPRGQLGAVLGILAAAGFYVLLMSVAAKKFDRYLLPVYPLLALIAGWGIVLAARRGARRLPGPNWAPAAAAMALSLLIQTSGVTASAPYYLSYYNPMLGGASAAPGAMMVGWGEGMDQVADYINQLPGSEELVVATEAWRSPMSYFLYAEAQFASYVGDGPGLYRWANSDFYLLYITPLHRRGVPQEYLRELEGKEPVLTITLNGLEYGRLYDIRDDPVPLYQELSPSGMIEWIGAGRMVAAGRTSSEIGATLGNIITETLYFDDLDPGVVTEEGSRIGLTISLIAPDGSVIDESDGPLDLIPPVRHGLWQVERRVTIPHDASPGAYQIVMRLYDRETGEALTGFSHYLGARMADSVRIDTFHVYETEIEADEPAG